MIANHTKRETINPNRIEQQCEMSSRVAIIILNFNRAKDTINLCTGILKNLSSNYSVIVVDNCSDDRNELIEYINSKNGFVTNPPEFFEEVNNRLFLINAVNNLGYAKGNNLGLRFAYDKHYSHAFIVNPDVIVTNYSVFDDLMQVFRQSKGKICAVGPRISAPDSSHQGPIYYRQGIGLIVYDFTYPLSAIFRIIRSFILTKCYGFYSVYLVIGCFFALDLNVWNDFGFFDENTFLYYEEAIIAEKARGNGSKIYYAPRFSVFHNHVYRKSWTKGNLIYRKSEEYFKSKYLKHSSMVNRLLWISSEYRRMLSYPKMKYDNVHKTHSDASN